MYRYRISEAQLNPSEDLQARVEVELIDRDVAGNPTITVQYEWPSGVRDSKVTFLNRNRDEISSLPMSSLSVLESATKMADQKRRSLLNETIQ